MAFTSAKKKRGVMGGMVVEVFSFNAASVTSGTISTGLSKVQHVSLNNEVTEGDGLAVINSSDASKVDLSGLTSDDTGTVLVVGY